MITNIFSIFDPSTSYFHISSSILILPILINSFFLNNNSKSFNFLNLTYNLLTNEIFLILINNTNNNSPNFLFMFFLILFIFNFFSLSPHTFTITAQLILNFPYAITLYISFILFSLNYNFNNSLIHLIPIGTPLLLIPIITLIELISNLIRPITLIIRLTANITAGHILLSIISSLLLYNNIIFLTITILNLTLIILELFVTFIQAYVFLVLLTLYFNETH